MTSHNDDNIPASKLRRKNRRRTQLSGDRSVASMDGSVASKAVSVSSVTSRASSKASSKANSSKVSIASSKGRSTNSGQNTASISLNSNSVPSSAIVSENPHDHDNEDENDDNNAANVSELLDNPHESKVDLHPHDKLQHRRKKTSRNSKANKDKKSDGEVSAAATTTAATATARQSSSRHKRSSSAKSNSNGDSGSGGRRRKPSHSSETIKEVGEDATTGAGNGWGTYLSSSLDKIAEVKKNHHSSHGKHRSSRSSKHHGSHKQHRSSSSSMSTRSMIRKFIKFFDGVSFKTVLLCIMGMTIVMKLNKQPSNHHHPPHDVQNPNTMIASNGLRGTMSNNEGAIYGDTAVNQQYSTGEVASDGLDSLLLQQQQQQPLNNGQPPPPLDNPQQQQQQQQMAQQGYAPQQNSNYAVGGQSIYNQSPEQQLGNAVPATTAVLGQVEEGVPITSVPDVQAAVPLVPPPAPPGMAAAVPGSVLGFLSNFKDTWDPYEKTDIPMFWHIPKAGGSSIKDTMGGCHRFVQATEFGVTDGHGADTQVAIVYPAVPGVADTDRSPFVNIDSTTVAGIARAKSMGFADANLAQLVVSPYVFETNDLFTPTAKGRLFSVFRHPIERAVSMFYYIRVADWEPSYKPELQQWTLEQYATSDIIENNWMTRQLSNQLGGQLTEDHLRRAMEVVRTKFLVGLMSKIEHTMARVEKFFRMTYHVNPTNQEACRERLMSGGSNSNAFNKKPVAEGDPAWDLLARQNNFDLPLYKYIEKLFDEQAAFVQGLPDDFRKVDGTCCKCSPATYPPEGFTCPQAVKNQ
eukprot:CAMPEP_0201627284 /NCGR_PEP_ID=MMETSP0493-20130528/2455_1 /ASSEMBLY_ACC=CAM_ASM_000838 /TAXON_ID=420259 /ORGANISM="Thalassiosira gravida, Strain GMp14c1" /LENGTH=803 /DNA_ID=CAMNT_0048097643 /DNA_START=122 /DNA_END=2533 /DNA_ORIENTATION=-